MEQSTKDKIQNIIDENDVLLFMKGTPVMPQCGFSAAVVGVLSHMGIKYNSVNVLEDPENKRGYKRVFRLANNTTIICKKRICWWL